MLGAIVTCALFAGCSSELSHGAPGSTRDRVDTLQSGGLTRTFEVHLPIDYETVSSPVVILFHGLGGDGLDMRYLTSFDIDADAFGFLAVYPNATSDWAYGCGCTDAEAEGVDDVLFVADLLDELDADYGINRDSVFVVGFADGALMAQKVVCDAVNAFVGLATVGATMSVPVAETCVPAREIPVLMFLGSGDAVFPWNGSADQGLESLLSADTTAQFWATNNGCGDRRESAFLGRDNYYYFDVYSEGFEDCPVNGDVILYRMQGAGHGWPNAQFSASHEIGGYFGGDWSGAGAPAFSARR